MREQPSLLSCLTKETKTYLAWPVVLTALHVWPLQQEKVGATREVQALLIPSYFHARGEGLFSGYPDFPHIFMCKTASWDICSR